MPKKSDLKNTTTNWVRILISKFYLIWIDITSHKIFFNINRTEDK